MKYILPLALSKILQENLNWPLGNGGNSVYLATAFYMLHGNCAAKKCILKQ